MDRYRHADPETTYLVVTTPTVVIRRAAKPEEPAAHDRRDAAADAQTTTTPAAAPASGGVQAPSRSADSPVSPAPARSRRKLRRPPRAPEPTAPIAVAVGWGHGSAARSAMPDGTVVESREERFAANLAVARAYAAEHGHLLPKKHERPGGVNLLMWLKNQELRVTKGTMPADRLAELQAIPEWRARAEHRGVGVATPAGP